MIHIKALSKNYNGVEVLKDINLEIQEGKIYGIIGHSGAGKSTLLRCINGLETYNSGSLKVMGQEVSELSMNDLRAFRKDLGMIFQGFNLLKTKTVFDNVALPLQLWGYNKQEIKKRVNDLLELVGLEDKWKSKPANLSGGQKQRVAIARALVLEPKILLCDEATSALDPKMTKDILSLLQKINKELGLTIVVVTHQMEVVKELCEKVALIEGGLIRAEGDSEELFLRPGISLKKFLGEEEEETLPQTGVNIRLYFSRDLSGNSVITEMARKLDIDFSIVWGKLEKFREDVLGSLVINIKQEQKHLVINHLKSKDIIWEVL